nr:hypothetical protein [Rickettsia asembonensis]
MLLVFFIVFMDSVVKPRGDTVNFRRCQSLFCYLANFKSRNFTILISYVIVIFIVSSNK